MRAIGPTRPVMGDAGYSYNIGTYDVTNTQYAFLNSNDPAGTDTLGAVEQQHEPVLRRASITTALPMRSKYVVGLGRRPDSGRFRDLVSQPASPIKSNGQVAGSTETGAYTLWAVPHTVERQ